jgi:hypothetical protein
MHQSRMTVDTAQPKRDMLIVQDSMIVHDIGRFIQRMAMQDCNAATRTR